MSVYNILVSVRTVYRSVFNVQKIYDAIITILFFLAFGFATAIQILGISDFPQVVSATIGNILIGLTLLSITPVMALRWQNGRGGSLLLGYYACTAFFVMFVIAPLLRNILLWSFDVSFDTTSLVTLILVLGFLVWWRANPTDKSPEK